MSETNQPPVPGQLLAPPRPQSVARRVVEDDSALRNLMDTGRYEHLQRVAKMMSMSAFLPQHLRGYFEGQGRDKVFFDYPMEVQTANCFRVVNQAIRWGFDPFAMVDETYIVGGKLGYQGKLVAAVINSRAGLKKRLTYTFTGEGQNRTVVCHGTFEGETEDRIADLVWKDGKTNNQMWDKDPDQKLIYSVVMKWARRHCPEMVLGVMTDDDVERMASNPPPDERPATGSDPSTASALQRARSASDLNARMDAEENAERGGTGNTAGLDRDHLGRHPQEAAAENEGKITLPTGETANTTTGELTEPIPLTRDDSGAFGQDDAHGANGANTDHEPDAENKTPHDANGAPVDATAAEVKTPSARSTEVEVIDYLARRCPVDGKTFDEAKAHVEKRMRSGLFMKIRWSAAPIPVREPALKTILAGKFPWLPWE